MKYFYLILAIASVALLTAQTTITPSWSGVETQQLLANCQLHNSDSVVCVATDGVAFSYQGAAFVKVASQGTTGATGPAGPQGPAGATGATGPQPAFKDLPVRCRASIRSPAARRTRAIPRLTASSCKQTTP
jgi:hypothetical protein